MKYKTIVDTDEFKDFKFFEDGIGKYMVGKDANACADNSGWIPLYFTEVKKDTVIDKVRAEIEEQERWLMSAGYNAYNVGIALNAIKQQLKK